MLWIGNQENVPNFSIKRELFKTGDTDESVKGESQKRLNYSIYTYPRRHTQYAILVDTMINAVNAAANLLSSTSANIIAELTLCETAVRFGDSGNHKGETRYDQTKPHHFQQEF